MRFVIAIMLTILPLAAERTLVPKLVYTSPDTDLSAGALTFESPWVTAQTLNVRRKGFDSKVKIKSLIFEDYIYFQIKWKDKAPNNFHKPWKWDGRQRIYIVGAEREDSLIMRWEISGSANNRNSKNDLWYWGAERTKDFADDMSEIISENYFEPSQSRKDFFGRDYYLQIIGDSGLRCYKTVLRAPISLRTSRYDPQDPKGSRGDVQAKARWENEEWTLEIKRKMVTGNIDDIEFQYNKEFNFDISTSLENAHILNNKGSFEPNEVFPLQQRNDINEEPLDLNAYSPAVAKYVRQDILNNTQDEFPSQIRVEKLENARKFLFEYSPAVAEMIRLKRYSRSYLFRFEDIEENFPLKLQIPPEFHESLLEDK